MEYAISPFAKVGLLSKRETTRHPPIYKRNNAKAINTCVNGSVEGVTIAEMVVEITIAYFQNPNITSAENMPKIPKKI